MFRYFDSNIQNWINDELQLQISERHEEVT